MPVNVSFVERTPSIQHPTPLRAMSVQVDIMLWKVRHIVRSAQVDGRYQEILALAYALHAILGRSVVPVEIAQSARLALMRIRTRRYACCAKRALGAALSGLTMPRLAETVLLEGTRRQLELRMRRNAICAVPASFPAKWEPLLRLHASVVRKPDIRQRRVAHTAARAPQALEAHLELRSAPNAIWESTGETLHA